MKLAARLAAAVLAFAAPALAATPAPAAPAERIVLPSDVRPERYEIRVRPDAAHLSFTGHARIAVEVIRATDRIVLNAADLAFQHVSLSGVAAAPRVELDETQQTAAFVFDQGLPPGRYLLSIDYSGRIYAQASGLFALDSQGPGGKARALFTQFENSDARRFAPLWDEPAAKAVFSLTVEAPGGQMAVSNMPVAHVEPLPDGRAATTFADTPKMSSYLLFLALGDFERIHRQVGATDVGVVVRRGEAANARFALDAAAGLLPYYNDWFGLPYPLPKLDLVAGPGQSQFFGAMENWGAIFAFDHDLLLEPTASQADRQAVFIAIAHEMAHQWFGDLVTMAWWDDLWLNEGFASWMEHKAADHFHPEWNSSLQAMASRERAMEVDASPGTHPVITPIRDVFAASDAFDSITYQKGEAVIRMLERYVGEDAFRAGIRAYLARHAYGATTTDELWAEMERVSPLPVTDIAHDFTLQSGLPLIRAEASRGGLRLTQDRFAIQAPPGASVWRTPVRVAPAEGGGAWVGLVSRLRPQQVAIPPASAPVVNAGQDGYFRTAYAPDLWSRLAGRFASLAPEDQLGLLYDSRALGEAGVAPLGDFLELARAATRAQEPIVLNALADELTAMGRAYPPGRAGAAFRAFARARLGPILVRLGWDAVPGEAENVAGLRADLIADLGELDDPGVVAEARQRFEASLAAPEALPAALRYGVQDVVARRADPRTWAQLHALARAVGSTRERDRLYRLLGSAHDPALADRALALALSDEPPPTTAPGLIASVAARHPEKAFEFALAHRAQVESLLEPASRTIFFANLASGSHDPAITRRLRAFGRTVPASSRGEIDKAAAAVQRRHAFVARGLPEIDRWLAAHPDPAPGRSTQGG
ncbi:MAG: aminopeptidase [Phenylobacterium sp.]|nr:aminopeptidase [Phenylobacterium sp.]